MLLTAFDLEELARDLTRVRRAEADRERLIAQAPSPPRAWRRAGRALVQRLTRGEMVACTS